MRKFNTIKKSRKKSRDIDEKIEYLNNECQKTGLQEIMNTTDMYQGTTKVPNQNFSDFEGKSQGGYGLGLSGADGNGAGGASVGVVDNNVDCGANEQGLAGVAISPPHPVTGRRRCARTITNATGSGSPLRPGTMQGMGAPSGGALWFFDPNADGGAGRWRNFQWHTSQNAWGFWDTNFLGFFFLNTNLDQYVLGGVNIGTDIKNNIADINFGTNGSIGQPKTIVLTKNDLGDASHLPINIDAMSPQAYEYLKVASNYYSPEDKKNVINYYKKKQADPSYQPKPYELESLIKQMRAQGGDGTKIASHDNPQLKSVPATGPRGDQPAHDLLKQAVQGGGATPSTGKYPLGIPLRLTHYKPKGQTLSEGVKLGHFEPEVLNVDINDIRKGIMPEFPKDPPPEMIGGYSAKSRLVRKNPELPPFIKVTRKDLAKNHKLTDKEIQDFLDDVKRINEYIKKNPAELIYAMTRYPKDDPRLAQLNFKMDEMKRASEKYVETHFPENVSLFSKLQNKIKQNIEMTNPKNFTGHKEAPKFVETNVSEHEKRRKTIIKHFKKKK